MKRLIILLALFSPLTQAFSQKLAKLVSRLPFEVHAKILYKTNTGSFDGYISEGHWILKPNSPINITLDGNVYHIYLCLSSNKLDKIEIHEKMSIYKKEAYIDPKDPFKIENADIEYGKESYKKDRKDELIKVKFYSIGKNLDGIYEVKLTDGKVEWYNY